MKTIFYILSILVIAASAYFGYSNSNKIKEQIDTFGTTRSTKIKVQDNIADTTKELEDTTASLDSEKQKNSDLIADKENEESKFGQMEKSIDKYEVQIEEADAKLAEFAKIKAKIEEKLDGIDIPWAQIPDKITSLKDERKKKGDDLAQLDKLVEKLNKELTEKKADQVRLASRLTEIKTKIARNSKVGSITSVNTTWGFVVVNLGDANSNITPRSKLLVTRGGRLLGSLKPTSVEGTQTVCDLVLKDLVPGIRIQRGDLVTIAETVGN